MDSFQVKAVLAAARHGSFSRAATEFSYTPSAFSHMIARVEEDLGVRLFIRTAVGVTLSEAGRALLPRFEAMLADEQALRHDASLYAARDGATLRIGTYSSILRTFLAPLLPRFQSEHPSITLSLHVADDLSGWLAQDRADVVFADDAVFEKNEWTPILQDRYLAVAKAGLLPLQPTLSREQLYRYPHVFTDEAYLHRHFDREAFSALLYFKSEDDLSILDMVRQGVGVAVLPELVLQNNAADLDVFDLDPPLSRTVGFAYRRHAQNALALTKFIKFIKNNLPAIKSEAAN